jgi:hypothetical protein
VSVPTCMYWLVVRNVIVGCACAKIHPSTLPPTFTQYDLLNMDIENTSIDDILSGVHELGSSIPGTQGYSEAIPVSDNPTTVHAVPATAPTGHPNAAHVLANSVTVAPTGHPNAAHAFDPSATAAPSNPNAAHVLANSVTVAPTSHPNTAHFLTNPVPAAPTGHPNTVPSFDPSATAAPSNPNAAHVLANSVTVAPTGHPNAAHVFDPSATAAPSHHHHHPTHVLANPVPAAPTGYPNTAHVLANQNDGGHFATYGQHPGAQFPPVSTQYVPNPYALQPPPAFPYHVSPHAVSALCQFLMTAFAPPTSGYHGGFFR